MLTHRHFNFISSFVIKQFECHHIYGLIFPIDISETIERLVGMILKWQKMWSQNFKWENLKVFVAIAQKVHTHAFMCVVDDRKSTSTMRHRNENFYKFLEDVRENANMLKPYDEEENSFEKKSVSITRAYWRKKPREWKWLRVTAYCKINLLSISFETVLVFIFKWRANKCFIVGLF